MASVDVTQFIEDPADLRKWRTELPNIYDDLGLDPYQRALLTHYKRVCGAKGGKCDESVRTTGKRTKMSGGKVSLARRQLAERGFIIECEGTQGAGGDTVGVTVVDIWPLNWLYFFQRQRPDVDGWTVCDLVAWCLGVYGVDTLGDTLYRLCGKQWCLQGKQLCLPEKQNCLPGETKNKHEGNQRNKPEGTKRPAKAGNGRVPPPQNDPPPDADPFKVADPRTDPKFNQMPHHQQLFAMVAWVCLLDLDTITQDDRGKVNQTEGVLRRKGVKPDHLALYREWWDLTLPFGQRYPDPYPAAIRKTWGKFARWGRKKLAAEKQAQQVDPGRPADPPPPPTPGAKLWAQALNELALQMTRETFVTWLKPTKVVGRENGTLTVEVQNEFALDWLTTRLRGTIERTLTGIEKGVAIEFILPA